MTPWQTSLAFHGYVERKRQQHESDAWMMWHGAVIPLMKKIPPLSDFIQPKKQHKTIDEHAIIARLKQYQKRYKDGTGS